MKKYFVIHLSWTFLNTETTNQMLQQSRAQDSFRHILKSSASVNESLGPQFLITTTGIWSEPDTFDESRFIMTFLSRYRYTWVFKIRVLWKVFTKQFWCRWRRKHIQATESREDIVDYSRFTFVENTIKICQKRANFLKSDSFICFIRICKLSKED